MYDDKGSNWGHRDNILGGYVTAAADTLVITPSSWIGTTLVPHTALNVVMQQGQLSSVPTFAQWTQGQSVPGWSLSKNKAVA
ncbi:MAG: hypothetical protein ABSD56_10905, partial [Bryobacteraceae bacterium]